jgi:hypothetical protein
MTEVLVQNTTSNLEIADRQRWGRLPRVERRWNLHAVAGAVALLAALSATDASALALGRVTVQSMLGEPLRAEIDVPSITDDEASTLADRRGPSRPLPLPPAWTTTPCWAM